MQPYRQNLQSLKSGAKVSNPSQPFYSPQGHPDTVAQANVTLGTNVPIADVISSLQNANAPPQLRQAPFSIITSATVNTPQLLLPQDVNRMSFYIANPNQSGNLYFSFDQPSLLNLTYLGIPITPRTAFAESNGAVSMNDIWIWADVASLAVLAYQGKLAIEGNN